MRRRLLRARLFGVLTVLGLALILPLAGASAANTTEVVRPSDMNGWGFLAENTPGALGSFVVGPATAPLGAGSARLEVDSGEGLLLAKAAHNGLQLSDITTLSYNTYRSSVDAGNNNAVSIQLGWDDDAMAGPPNTFRGRLIFEPYLANGGGTIPQNTWQEWGALTAGAGWWTSMSGATLCLQSSPCTWADVQTNYPNAEIHSGPFGFVGFKAGSGPTLDGNVDDFVLGTAADTWTYDFEPDIACTTTCYVDGTNGNDAAGGDTPATAKKSIQAGINAVSPGGTVVVAAGTYYENVVVNKKLTLDGAGDGNTATDTIISSAQSPANNGLSTLDFAAGGTADNDRATVRDVRITGSAQRGVSYANNVGYVTLLHVTLDSTTRGIEFQSTGVNNLVLDDVNITNNSVGIRAGTAAGVANMLIDNSNISNNGMGSAIFATSSSTANETLFTGITIEDTTINNNLQKGLYFEKLDDAVLQRLTITDSGTDPTYAFNNGIDINLKHGTFDDIQILDSTFDGSGLLTTLNGGNDFSAAIALKARSDAPSYNTNPATLTDVTVANNSFIDSTTDVRVGEPTKSNPGPTDVRINDNSLLAGVDNASTAIVDASANWWGSNVEATVAASATGGNVDFTPFLDTGTDTSVDPGFQGDFSTLNVTALGSQSGSTGRIQEAVDLVDGSTVNVLTGTYAETVVADVPGLELYGPNMGISPNDPADPTADNPARVAEATIAVTGGDIAITVTVPDVVIDGFRFTASGADVANVQSPVIAAGANFGGDASGIAIRNNLFDAIQRIAVYFNGPDNAPMDGATIDDNRVDQPTRPDTGCNTTPTSAPGSCARQLFNPWKTDDLSFQRNSVIATTGNLDRVRTLNFNGGTSGGGDGATIADNTIRYACHFTCIALSGTATNVTVSGNDVISHHGNAVQLFTDWSGGVVDVTLNTFNMTNGDYAFVVDNTAAVLTGVDVNRNSFASRGVRNGTSALVAGTNTLDAQCNWWGQASGPDQTFPPDAFGPVDFTPWLESSNLTSACSGSPECETPPFNDVPVDHPFCSEIKWMGDEGISTGFNDGTYRPSNNVTRMAMAAFMARLADADLQTCNTAPFPDVPTDHPFCQEIQWMKDEGISTGFEDGTYRPADPVTRQAMAAFMARLAGAGTLPACTSAPFTDVSTSHPFCPEIQWMKDNGISTGFDDGTYRPSLDVTRQAMAAFMLRVSALL